MRSTIDGVISEIPDRSAVQSLFEASHRFALAYLRAKGRGHYLKKKIGLSLDDLALDCIADLFERDDEGRFSQIAPYFIGAGWPEMSDEAATIALRRLVFSKVNDGLFRRYREANSQVAKIIRNLKLATNELEDVRLVRRGGVLWLCVADPDFCFRPSPLVPPELVEARILARLHESTTIKHTLRTFVELVQAWSFYCNGYPLSIFARITFDAFRKFGEVSQDSKNVTFFTPSEITDAIKTVINEVQDEMHGTYVRRKKLRVSTYNAYFQAADDILSSQFVYEAADRASYFETLRAYIPELTEGTYRTDHRHILEYLAKVARRRLIDRCERVIAD